MSTEALSGGTAELLRLSPHDGGDEAMSAAAFVVHHATVELSAAEL